MTQHSSEQPKERCGFIVLCKWIRVETNLKCPVDNGNIKSCKYDTRSRPHPAPRIPTTFRIERDGLHFSINGGTEKILKLDEHDAATARKAREEALALLEEWDYYNNRNFGKPHPVFADMIRLVREKPDEIREHLKSLRAQQAGDQHE